MTSSDSSLQLIRTSQYFDAQWYRNEYPEIEYSADCPDPASHYLNFGWKEKRLPSVIFDGPHYQELYRLKSNPLLHYLRNGRHGYFPAVERRLEGRLKLQLGLDLTFGEKILYLQDLYQERNHKPLDLLERKPVTYTEKLYWYRLFYHDDEMTILADKYAARARLAELLGKDYCIPLLGVYDKAEDIDFEALPNSFVLKANWGTAQNLIVKDKSRYDLTSVRRLADSWLELRHNNYYFAVERSYRDIPPKLIAEQYIENSKGDLPDLKVMCFDGKPAYAFIVESRVKHVHPITFFDLDFKPQSLIQSQSDSPIFDLKFDTPKPQGFEEMLRIAAEVSKPFPHARVDFLLTDTDFYLGEVTFYPYGGNIVLNDDWDLRLGALFNLRSK